MKIVKFEKITQDLKINTTTVMGELKKLNKSKKKLTAKQKTINTLTKRYLKEIEEQVNMEKKNLYLNDEFMADKIGSTKDQARFIKRKLQSVGALVMARKQTGPGNYPLWFFNFEYVVFVDKEDVQPKKKRKSRDELYVQELLDIYAEVEYEVQNYFYDIEEDNRWWAENEGTEYKELVIASDLYYGMIEKRVSEVLSDMDMTRADFKI